MHQRDQSSHEPDSSVFAVRGIEHGQRQGIEQHRRLHKRHAVVFDDIGLRLDRVSCDIELQDAVANGLTK